ncbi:MAG TPA: hypothetical protein VF808_18435 [Ktedonobacterales bacterium]
MRSPEATPINAGGGGAHRSPERANHLSGPWLLLARVVAAALIILAVGIFARDALLGFAGMQIPCDGVSCATGQLSAEAMRSLERQVGVSALAYASAGLTLRLLSTLVWFLVAAIFIWRKPNDWYYLLFALQLVFNGAGHPENVLRAGDPLWQGAAHAVNIIYMALLLLVLALFPDGRFAPRWMGWCALIACALLLTPLVDSVFPLALGLFLVAQAYRYWRVSHLTQRLQARWILFASALVFLYQLATNLLVAFDRTLSQPGALAYGAIQLLTPLVFVLIPIAVGIAVLRYRLADIDTIINRALVYGSLTALLVALYAGLVVLLESLAGVLLGPQFTQQPLILVISTLAIAALVQPLRQRLQATIDRRFYRRKYDAARTLAAFIATLRQEVDLQAVREGLIMTARETMQPEHVSLWLRQPERAAGRSEHAAVSPQMTDLG